jgi:hypothetical protein
MGEDAAAVRVGEAVYGKTFFAFPALDGTDASSEIRGDLLPRVEPATLTCGRRTIRGLTHGVDSIAQRCAIRRHRLPGA